MPSHTPWPHGDDGVTLVHTDGYRLVAYPVAGANGSVAPGRRQISFAWYDATRDALLEELHCISPTRYVLAGIARESVPNQVRAELSELAQRIWPEPWRDFIIHALEHRDVFATPVAEYFPERLQRGRLAIIGDAAHVVSPMTGKGFVASTMDVGIIAGCLGQTNSQAFEDISLALNRYEGKRLKESRELATTSSNWSRAYLADVGFRRSGQSWPLKNL